MIPVVLIDATNYVYKCITTLVTTIQIRVSFSLALFCKISVFCPASSAPLSFQ